MAMTVEILKARLRRYLEAEAAILRGQEYQLDSRRLRRAELSQVRAEIKDLMEQIALLENTGGRVKRVVFIE